MRKAIAQTLSGKRLIVPIAVIAAIAVFATLGTHFKSDSASAADEHVIITKSAAINVAPKHPTLNQPSGGGQVGGNYIIINVLNNGAGANVNPIVVTDTPSGASIICVGGLVVGVLPAAPIGGVPACAGNTLTWTIPAGALAANTTLSIAVPVYTASPVAGTVATNTAAAQITWDPDGIGPGGNVNVTLSSNTVTMDHAANAELREFDVDAAAEAAAGGVGGPQNTCLTAANQLLGTGMVFGVPPLTGLGAGLPCFYTYTKLIDGLQPSTSTIVNQGYMISAPQMFTLEDNNVLRGQREGLLGYHDGFHDKDDATGSQHMICVMAMMPEDNNAPFPVIQWNILPTAGSAATINPPGGTKIFRSDLPGYNFLDPNGTQYGVNCVVWRSSGTGGQNVTARVDTSYTISQAPAGPHALGAAVATGQGPFADIYWDSFTFQPKVKEWNTIDTTKIVRIPSGEGSVGTNIWGNTGSVGWWRIPGTIIPLTVVKPSNAFCLRDPLSLVPINFTVCANGANVDWAVTNTVIQGVVTGIQPTGGGTGLLRPSSAVFIDYTYGSHKDFSGTIDGQLQIFTLNPLTGVQGGVGTCGSLRVEDPVDGRSDTVTQGTVASADPAENAVGNGGAVSVIGSDMGVAFQVYNTANASAAGSTGVPNCSPNEYTVVRIQTREEVQLRSDLDVAPDEYVVIQWIVQVGAKKVFLAWAGQRVVIEQDWRIFGGDRQANPFAPVSPSASAAPTPIAGLTCVGDDGSVNTEDPNAPAGTFRVIALKGTGPGNFIPQNGVVLTGPDMAEVNVSNGLQQFVIINQIDEQASPHPDVQNGCISRFPYESEDPGEVDIELFVRDGASSKVAFVIYYMKIEDVKVSLVKDVSKPTHNGPSNANIFAGGGYNPDCVLQALVGCGDGNDFPHFDVLGGGACVAQSSSSCAITFASDPGTNGDWAFQDDKGAFTTGNPWDASKDVTEVDWNVSKDLLVRVRVRGWFLNTNPSGRAREDKDPLNVRPADRWIMPDDWVTLAGGAGTAEQFNPQYDLMIAPNNAAGRALMDPTGRVGATAVVTLTAAMSAADQTMTVSVGSSIPVGACLLVDNEWLTVVQKAGNVLTVGRYNLATGGTLTTIRSAGIGCAGVTTAPAAHASGARVGIFQLLQPLVLVPTLPVGGAVPFEGPLSLLDLPGLAAFGTAGGGAALSNLAPGQIRDTIWGDGVVNSWDAPMPPLPLTVDIRGAGFIRQVLKYDVYYLGTPNTAAQVYPNPYYHENIPGHHTLLANNFAGSTLGTGFFWNSWGNIAITGAPIGSVGQGPYTYWQAIPQWTQQVPNSNAQLRSDTSVTAAERRELAQIRIAYGSAYTTLAAAVSALDTSIKVADATNVTVGAILQVDDEFMTVTGKSGNVLLVTRNTAPFGIEADVAAVPHANGTVVAIYQNGRATTAEASTIGRTLVIYSDNHGEGMVTANGDFKLDYSGCATNAIGGGKHCAQGDKVGTSTINSVANYPDFFGKHPPIKSNDAKVTWTWGGYKEVTIEKGETDQYKYVVFHALDRDGWCDVPAASISLHPVLTAEDELLTVGANDPDETVDFLIDGGAGKITEWAGLARDGASGERGEVTGVETFSTSLNDPAAGGFREFPTLHTSKDECQAWVKISSSLLDVIDILVEAHDDEGDIGFDRVIDFTNTTTYSLSFRWSLITWAGADGISPTDALKATGGNAGGTDIFSKVTAVYGWNQAAQTWQAFFPSGVGVPGANDLTALKSGQAYWVAIVGPDAVTWTIVSNVN